jgi:2-keto-4-pentenoate hydratase
VRAAIAGLGPAIELADLDHPPDDVETILAGNIYQQRVVLGAPDPARAGAKVDGLVGRVIRRGIEAASTDKPQTLTGDIVGIVRHVADLLAVFGEQLKTNDVIIAGSIVPPILPEPDEETIGFVLEPVGSVSVRLKA